MPNIFEFVTTERNAFKKPINITDGWSWGMQEHINRSFLYKNSQFTVSNENRDKRPFNNIVRPILNVQYRTEGFDVKDIEIYVNNSDNYHKSLLVRKFHDKWALKHGMDTFIDELVESYVDYGGVLVKKVDGVRPEVIDLKTIAFCDQTNILSGPFAIRHQMSPDELRGMADAGWGKIEKGATIDLETLIRLSEKTKENSDNNQKTNTPGKYTEIFELHGTFPESWLKKEKKAEDETEEAKYVSQVQVVAFYKNDKDEDIGVVLFAAREPKLPFKFLNRDKVAGRALGFGGIEELFEHQVWTNYSELQIMEMLELASKVFYKTTDSRFKTRNNISQRATGTVFDLQAGTDIGQLDTTPRNINIFENANQKWERRAQIMGAASELMLNESPTSGTPFKSVEAQLIEGHSLHAWRKGKIASFLDEIYRDWILPQLSKEIVKGDKFMVELSMDELQDVMERVSTNFARRTMKEKVLNGENLLPDEEAILKEEMRQEFAKGGRNRFIEILKDEFKDDELEIKTSIVGKQRNSAQFTDKLVNLFRQVVSAPQILQDPYMGKLFNQILEASNLSPIMFGMQSTSLKQPMGANQPVEQRVATTT